MTAMNSVRPVQSRVIPFLWASPLGEGQFFLPAGCRAAVKERESKQAKRYADYRFACLLFRRMENGEMKKSLCVDLQDCFTAPT